MNESLTKEAVGAELRAVAPAFLVADVNATAKWYAEHLGFETAGIFPPNPPASWASLQRDGVEIMLQRLPGYAKPDLSEKRAGGVWHDTSERAGSTLCMRRCATNRSSGWPSPGSRTVIGSSR